MSETYINQLLQEVNEKEREYNEYISEQTKTAADIFVKDHYFNDYCFN